MISQRLIRSQPLAHGFVAGDEIPIVWDVVGEQCPEPFDVVAPITVQFAGHSKPVHQLNASSKPRRRLELLLNQYDGHLRVILTTRI